MPSEIKIEDMSVGWATQRVIPSLQLTLAAGETLSLVGPGGSGKSTVLRVLEQLVDRDSGAAPPEGLWWRGRHQCGFRRCARLRQHGEFAREPISELLAAAGLHDSEDWMPPGQAERELLRAVWDMPLGEAPDPLRRFLSLVLVAYDDAPLLLLDEPCFGLHGVWARCVEARLEALRAAGRAMVIVTHYLPLARSISDRVMLIVDGRVIEAAPVEDFFERAQHPRTLQFLTWGG